MWAVITSDCIQKASYQDACQDSLSVVVLVTLVSQTFFFLVMVSVTVGK